MEKTITLRPYQEKFINNISEKLRTHRKVVAQLATGGGKTVCFSAICDRFCAKSTQDILILVHREELLLQASKAIKQPTQQVVAGMRSIPPARVYIAMVESAYKRLHQFTNIGMVIVDECFIAGTKVSGKNIEEIVYGDFVDSYNHSTGLIEKRKVIATSKKENYNDLLLINFSCAAFVCTQEHPIFVEGKGYIPAKDLQINDLTYGLNKLHTLQSYTEKRKLFRRGLEIENLEEQKKWNNILFFFLQGALLCKNAFRKNDLKKSNDESRNYFKSKRNFKTNRTQTFNTRGKRERNDSTSKNAFRRTWRRLVSGINCCYRKWIFSNTLQDRFRISGKENSSRSGWWNSSFIISKKERQEKGRTTTKQRVQSIEIYQQGDFKRCETDSKSNSNFVYNIEVEGNNNYFANGILVHNCHIGNFTKVIEHFKEQYIIGFTATPLAAKKTNPLKNYFSDIVCGIDIPELIDAGFLCPEQTYSAQKIVERAKLKMTAGDFDAAQMGAMFKEPKYIDSTINAYKQHSLGRKTIIFNCNVEHSQAVNLAFQLQGFNSRHLDATSADREEILQWFSNTPDAILNNIGIATTGFDQPDIETVIVNKATASMPLWLQMCGRGARPHPIKLAFTIIDLGGNCLTHGSWASPRNWYSIFHNPKKPCSGVAPVKECPQCQALLHTSKMLCSCGYAFPKKIVLDAGIEDFILMTESVDIKKLIAMNTNHKEYRSLFLSVEHVAFMAKKNIKKINSDNYLHIEAKNHEIARLWCREKKKNFNRFHRELVDNKLKSTLKQLYNADFIL